jgi:hypothetical protein
MGDPDLEALRRHRAGQAKPSYRPPTRSSPGPPAAPPSPPPPLRPPRRGPSWLLVGALAAGIIVLVYTLVASASGPPTPSGSTAAAKDPSSSRAGAAAPVTRSVTRAKAAAVVRRYFQAINDQDYTTAYALLGVYFHRRQSYEDFSAGFSETVHDNVRLVSTTPAGSARYRVAIELAAEQRDGSVRRFSGTYVVGREGGSLKVVAAQVRRIQ